MRTSIIIFDLGLLLLMSAALTSTSSAQSRSGEPVRKPTLSIALDDGAASRMLRSELSRDWLQPNPSLRLTARQRTGLAVIGHSMNALQAQIVAQFSIVYVDEDSVPTPVRLHLPAIRINHGRWESIDRRAFAFETRPLWTLDWYRSRYAALFTRDANLDVLAGYGCSDEGYSGPAQVETPAPWDHERSVP